MLDYRLMIGIHLLLLCTLQQASNVPVLKASEVKSFINESGTACLIGYTNFPDCEYTNEFINQMQIVQNSLTEQKVRVAIVNETVGGLEPKRGPFSMLYRQDYDPFRIDWLSDGHEIAKWLQLKLNSSASPYYFKNQAEYSYFVSQYKTVFSAYLTDENAIKKYKKVADEFNALFLITSNSKLAENVLKTVSEKIIVEHFWMETVREEYIFHDFKEQDVKKWMENQIYKTPKELTPQNAKTAFSSKTRHISIFFVPKSDPKIKELIQRFELLHNFGDSRNDGKFSLFYVDSRDSNNKPLLSKFGVKRNSKVVVLLTTYNNLAQIPFTNQCASGAGNTLEESMLKFESIDVYSLHLSNQQLID